MAPEPIGSHPIPELDVLFIDFRLGQVNQQARTKWHLFRWGPPGSHHWIYM